MQLFLFNSSTFQIEISPLVTQLKPLNAIVLRDKGKIKTKAIAELSFIWFQCDNESDFQSILDDGDREKEIISVLENLPPGWKPDTTIRKAMAFYVERSKSIASEALKFQKENITKLIANVGKFMESEDSNDLSRATTISDKIPSLIESISKLEKIVKGQRETESRHRGSQEKGMMEDDI
jgi:hypothetical protein